MVDIGIYGSTGDNWIFNAISFNKKLNTEYLDLLAPTNLLGHIDGYIIPLVFAGDQAFPLKQTWCGPFQDKTDSDG